MQVVNNMHDRGYRIWYDEGIEVGSEWPECIAEHLNAAHLVVAFVSNAYIQSDNCRREMNYSLTKKKKIINIFLGKTDMTPGMEMQIGSIFALMKYSMKEQAFYDRLYSAPLLNSEAFLSAGDGEESGSAEQRESRELERRRRELALRKERLELERLEARESRRQEKEALQTQRKEEQARKKEQQAQKKELAQQKEQQVDPKVAAREKRRKGRKKRLIINLVVFTLLLGLAIAAVIVGYFTGYGERLLTKTVTVSPLAGDTTAEFTEPLFERAAREFTGISQGEIKVSDLSGMTQLYISGDSYRFDEAELASAAAQGGLRDLSDLAFFTRLDTLYISGQELSSLDSLPPANIEQLRILDCPVSSLAGISDLPKLRVLVTDGCPVNDLGDINRCLMLKTLSLVGSRISDYTVLKPLVKLADFSTSNCTMDELYTVRYMGSITSFSFYNCDFRGRFFKSFDQEHSVVSMRLVDCQLDSTLNIDDFSALSELYLYNVGADLDWSALPELPALKTIYVDAGIAETIDRVMKGTNVKVEVLP